MPRLTSDKWKIIRAEYESDPACSFGGLAEKYGARKTTVYDRAKKEGWQKAGETASINDAAYRRADAAPNEDERVANEPVQLKRIAAREESEEKRAAVIVLHRQEWQEVNQFRKAALMKMKEAHDTGDKDAWWKAKIASDTCLYHMRSLDIKQLGERRAWGLEQVQGQLQQPAPRPLLEIK
jgi:hypothetical protein